MSINKEFPPQQEFSQLEDIDPEVIRKVGAATVHIACQYIELPEASILSTSNATGIHIGEGKILTARHVTDRYGKDALIMVFKGIIGLRGLVIASSNNEDLSILQTNYTNLEKVEISSEKLSSNQTLLVTGFPGISHTFRCIYIADIHDLIQGLKSWDTFLLRYGVDTKSSISDIRGGFSGGGVFNTKGQLVGMLFRRSEKDQTALAVKGSAIQSFLETIPPQAIPL